MRSQLVSDWLFYEQVKVYPGWLKDSILKKSNTLTVYDLEDVINWLNYVGANIY
jgi:hypothetical protein